ncbi:MAG: AMP-binding protein [Actinobacteria bacterium]|nr:AMP-binding protein [Actinomycetota bacterium]
MGLARNMFSILDRAARSSRAADVAFRFEDEDRTFGELRERSLRFAGGLIEAGVEPGDRVAVLLGNGHEWPEIFFGLAAMGAVCVPVNVLLRPAEVAHLLADSGARCLVVDSRSESLLAMLEGLPELVVAVGEVDVDVAEPIAYQSLLASAPAELAGPGLDDLATLYYSSGTTGLPKAAAHTHDGILWNSVHQIADLRLTGDDVYLLIPSLSWAAGFHVVTLPLLWLGGRSVMMPTGGTTPDRITAAIEENGVTHTLLVPTLLRQFLESPELLKRLRATPLRWVISGTEPVPRPVIEAIAEELPATKIVQGYGMSEFPTVATALLPEEAASHAGSAGRACSITDIAVQTDDGTIASAGEGEVLLRSPATMSGYFGRPEETEAAFADGWLHTGDVGRIDEEGFLTITGRKKDMIISGGMNVYPKEVEEVIYRLSGVLEVAVVGIADERWGEAPVAVVIGDGIDAETIDGECERLLASYKRPRRVIVREEPLPRNATGKVLKRELRPWVAEHLGLAEQDTEKVG